MAREPTYEIRGTTHCFVWPDQIRLEVHTPTLDSYGRLWCDLAAYSRSGAQLNQAQLNLKHDRSRLDFMQTCSRMNGHVAWMPRLLFVAYHVDQTLKQAQQQEQAVWEHLTPAYTFAYQTEPFQEQPLVQDLLYPGCITFLAAPRGTGKSHVALALYLAASMGGPFRGTTLTAPRVVLVDRDNPPSLLRRRLRAWGVAQQATGTVLAREHAPSLRQREAWQAFPVEACDALILDSWQSFTEGVSEQEPRQFQEALAALKDLARRGPAILVLDNTVKSGEHYRGRGEKADMVDIFYEVRDCTNWTPSAPDAWWESLPDAGEKEWQSRATRRHEKHVLRVAFVPSKFRLDAEPEPFILELDLRTPPWTLRDVTADVVDDAAMTSRTQAAAARDALRRAIEALATEVARQVHAGTPLNKAAAEAFLMNQGVTQRQARTVLHSQAGTHWVFVSRPELPGTPLVLYPGNSSGA